jgi:hypothetical protein
LTGRVLRRTLALGLAAAALYLFLLQPNHPRALTWEALTSFPLEWPVMLLALAALGQGRVGTAFRVLLVTVLLVLALMKAADLAMFTALARAFNPVADFMLVDAGLRLLTGAIGPVMTGLALLGALTALVALGAALWWATGVWAGIAAGRPALRATVAVAAVVSAGIAVSDAVPGESRWTRAPEARGTAFTMRYAASRAQMAAETWAGLRAFEAAAAEDPFAGADGLLDLIDRDVIVVFVESYGRTSLDTPLYADLHRATLRAGEAALRERGLSVAAGLLASPTRGGQSWLAHATFANGLWVDGAPRYSAVLASGRETLYHLAARSGFHTAAVMPQITLEWPESDVMGFETILAARDLGYAGLNFNWVTMPDQFTFAAMDRLLRADRPDDRNYLIQVATGSSHAPWVPVPELVDWDAIGDGRVFNVMAASGDPPDVVWRDRDRVRAQYRLAVDYALQTVLSYAARHADDPPLMIVVGDHQAAGFVALDERPDVPIHLIGPDHLVEKAAAEWGLAPGLIPAEDAPVVPMDRMRDRILRTFSSAPAAVAG